MMRVAYICADPGVPVFGTKGSSVHVQEIVRAWRRAGADVTVYCVRAGTDRPADLAGLGVVERPPRRAEPAARERAIEEAALALADATLLAGCDVVYERYSLFSPALSVLAGELGVPAVLEVNAPLIEEQQRYRQLFDADLAESILRRNATAADAVACVSEPVLRWVTQRVPEARTILVPNGVNTSRITARPADRRAGTQAGRRAGVGRREGPPPAGQAEPHAGRQDQGRFTVAFTGTLKPWHGVPDLLEAVALANADPKGTGLWAVRIIGDGPGRPDLERLAAELGVEAEFTGAVLPESVPRLLHECDAAAAPYPQPDPGQDHYFSPLKVYEYLAAGMPVIATSVGQIPSVLEQGRTGLMVPAGDPAAFADALHRLAADAALRERLGTQARAAAVEHHSWDGVLSRITAALASRQEVA